VVFLYHNTIYSARNIFHQKQTGSKPQNHPDSHANKKGARVFASPLIFSGAEVGILILHQESL
jgi:hypothetical protein